MAETIIYELSLPDGTLPLCRVLDDPETGMTIIAELDPDGAERSRVAFPRSGAPMIADALTSLGRWGQPRD